MTHHIRSADLIKEKDLQTPRFAQRKHRPVTQITNLFASVSVLLLAISVVFFYDVLTGFYICGASAIVVYFIARQLNELEHLLSSTEFLNALFSATSNRNYKFTLIIREDGEFIYVNHAFQVTFPKLIDGDVLNLATMYSLYNIAPGDQATLNTKLAQASSTSVEIPMVMEEGSAPQTVKFLLEPIPEFEQYTLIHGA